jgi:hypothetical protein
MGLMGYGLMYSTSLMPPVHAVKKKKERKEKNKNKNK